jgi:hypothetical protein
VSREALARLKRVLQSAARDCMKHVEHDRSPPAERLGAAFVPVLRSWAYSGFKQFEREEPGA